MVRFLLPAFLLFWSIDAVADHIGIVIAQIVFENDGSFAVTMSLEAGTEAEDSTFELKAASEIFIEERLGFRIDGVKVPVRFDEFVEIDRAPSPSGEDVPRQCITEGVGTVPKGSGSFELSVSEGQSVIVVLLTVANDKQLSRQTLHPGQVSEKVDLTFLNQGGLTLGRWKTIAAISAAGLILILAGILVGRRQKSSE